MADRGNAFLYINDIFLVEHQDGKECASSQNNPYHKRHHSDPSVHLLHNNEQPTFYTEHFAFNVTQNKNSFSYLALQNCTVPNVTLCLYREHFLLYL